jgi:adenylosuccinate lyase
MSPTEQTAISPIDGRYRSKVEVLSKYFSESALIKYRFLVEVKYFIALHNILPELKGVSRKQINSLLRIELDEKDILRIKKIENVTNHDVKAVEYFLKEKFNLIKISEFSEFIHFGLTSQDINNTAVPLSLKDAMEDVIIPEIKNLILKLKNNSKDWKKIPILAHTHGQPASPTRLGKEIAVFVVRLEEQLRQLKQIPFSAKFGGATGNFNAHKVAYPRVNWLKFAKHFVEIELGLKHSFPTTQIEHYDNLASYFDCVKRINNILIDLDRDMWLYISYGYFKQKIKAGEVGSSAMPHKVNPIDFENSEGNLGVANSLLEHFSAKLPISRLQRDLTDSTVLRNIGVPFAHSLLAYKSLLKGLDKLIVNKEKINEDLENNWVVVSEAIQTILRREGYPKPYEKLKELTRSHIKINKVTIHNFIDRLDIAEKVKNDLKKITPQNYTGI